MRDISDIYQHRKENWLEDEIVQRASVLDDAVDKYVLSMCCS
jgi:hypothetical protein